MSAPVVLTTQRQGLPDILNGLRGLDLSRFSLDNNAEPDQSVTVFKHTMARSLSVIAGGSSGTPCPVHVRIHIIRSKRAGPCTCSLADILNGSTGHVADSHYLAQVNVSSDNLAAQNPLVVISLDGVFETDLQEHIHGGYTDVISRPYLRTLMKYLTMRENPWCYIFYTSRTRQEGIRILEELNLPTPGPEDDERDGDFGLFSAEDMRHSGDASYPTMDLESIWDTLHEEQGGRRRGVHNTVVLTHNPPDMAKQPYNYVAASEFPAESDSADDLFLLLAIAILKDLETETNFAFHIKEMEYNDMNFWTDTDPQSVAERNAMLYNSITICAEERITIQAMGGNKRRGK